MLSKDSDASLAAMTKVLKIHYNNADMVSMIAAGKTSKSLEVENLSTKLENSLFPKWMKYGKTEGDAFTLMGLKNTPVGDLIQRPAFSMWMSYAAKLETHDRDGIGAINVLKENYHEVDLALAPSSAKSVKNTKDVQKFASELQEQQFKLWKSSGWTVDDIQSASRLRSHKLHPRDFQYGFSDRNFGKLMPVMADYKNFNKNKAFPSRA